MKHIGMNIKLAVGLLAAAAVMCAAGGQSSQRVERPAPPARIGAETCEQFAERMRWFVDARFGMFIHFGLYSLPAWHEWIKTRRVVPEEAYQRYFDNFNPDLFDAREWVRKAKSAGMRYIVLTAKHHEGFCLWDTKFTDYKITNTPFGRDLVRELVDVCHQEGMRIGFYYSLLDWHHPDFTVDPIHPLRPKGEECWGGVGTNDKGYEEINSGRDMRRYVQYMKDQIAELLTNYGRIDLLWYDFSYPDRGKCWTSWDSVGLLELTRKLQPWIIVNDRLDLSDVEGGWDFVTVEQKKADSWPIRNGRRAVWETCQTFSGSWGYARDENSWKSPEDLVELLFETVSKGGNLILNVGPTGRGDFDWRANDRLEAMSRWMRFNGRSIYGCTRAPEDIKPPDGTLLTWNDSSSRLYVAIVKYPDDGELECQFSDRVLYAQLLHDASEVKVDNGKMILPKDKPKQSLVVVEASIRR